MFYTADNYSLYNNIDYVDSVFNVDVFANTINSVYYKKMQILENKETGENVKLKFPMIFKIEVDKNGIYYSNDEYNLYASGETQAEAENDVFEEFMINYCAYAREKDNLLDTNAKNLKYKLLKICGDFNA